MSSSKNYNSIVFLTTLSVYLGLILVGGAGSPVLAQAALTRNFDIQEEIEHKDDLDKKPDEDQILSEYFDSFQKLYSLNQDFAEKYHDEFGNYELNCTVYSDENSDLSIKISGKSGISTISSDFTSQISRIRNLFISDLAGTQKQINIKILFSHNDFLVKTSFKRNIESSKIFLDSIVDKNIFSTKVQNFEDRLKIFGQQTTIETENNQVFIITNLPRASIDSLLAEKDAN